MPLSPTAALEVWAQREPEQPWLFYPHGFDLRWISWRWGAARVGSIARRLRGLGLVPDADDPPPRIAFPYRSDPQSVLLDLGIQAASLVSVPVPGSSTRRKQEALAQRRGSSLWVEMAGGEAAELPGPPSSTAADPSAATLSLEVRQLRDGRWQALAVGPEEPPVSVETGETLSEGAVVGSDGEERSAQQLAVASEQVAKRLGGALPKRARDILVSWRCLDRWDERQLLAWSLASGAALVLEPEPSRGLAAALWARPTVFAGTPEETMAFRRTVSERRGLWQRLRSRRRPLGRLRAVVWLGPPPPSAEEAAAWKGWGVELVVYPLPQSTPSSSGVGLPL